MLFDYFLAFLLFLCGVWYGYRAGHEAGYQGCSLFSVDSFI